MRNGILSSINLAFQPYMPPLITIFLAANATLEMGLKFS